MDCLFSSVSSPAKLVGHSTKIGTALDGNPIYGKYISVNGIATLPTDLDACGGRVGFTPDSPDVQIYYYVITQYAPFSVGCFASKGTSTGNSAM